MQRLTIDLKKNAEVADLVSDKEPGDKLVAELSIVSMDEQSLVVELDTVRDETVQPEPESDEDDAFATGDDDDADDEERV